ncbi:MAG TPA: ATP-dependent DNA helicase RecG [Methylomirabilota bacterium]|nr:ATP-dependent DNA helicase RecG [Methylomirabilota bacterium]
MNPAAKAPAGLDTSLQYLKGVGPQRARLLERLGLATVRDALNHFPRDYQDRREFVPFHKLPLGETGVVQGTVFGVAPPPRGSRAPVQVTFRDQTGYFTALWFGRGFLAQVFKRDQRVVLYGKKALAKDRRVVLESPDFEIVEEDELASIHMGRVVPVYSLTEGLFQRPMRTLLYQVVEAHAEQVPDILPDELRRRRDLVPVAAAYRAVHFPDRLDDIEAARRRFAFEDFFVLQVGLTLRRRRQAREHGRPLAPPGALVARLLRGLPFALTSAQERVWAEIRSDLARPVPMNRLLQGDVGSGKTIVAVMALLTAVEAGCQALLMAPTEILAEQHLRTVRALVEPLGLSVAWLAAGQRARDRQAALEALRGGAAAIGVGTHALIQETVELQRLGLAVVDEQHRFGVLQRASIRGKGEHPHVLVMTATPIPRTLALTLYGDLDVSVLDQLPPGRTPIRTEVRREPARARIYEFVRSELRAGRQAYVVCPLVEETEASDLKAATEMAERLQAGAFRDFRVGLIHGRLAFEAKDAVMRAFKAGDVDVLVATTVVEVGIDVPNASVMLIEHAERFGLAQLHQLRGRVGRGAARSFCVLIANEPLSDDARQRLDAMAETQDGFRLAEADLEIRGPGEFFGTRQSGLPEFRTAGLVTHARLLEQARDEAAQLVARDPGLASPEHRALREALLARWRERLELASIG